MMIRVIRSRGVLAPPVSVLRMRGTASPISGMEGSLKRGIRRGPGSGVAVGVGEG